MRGVPLTELPSDRDIVLFVQGNAGAVGYVSPGTPTAGVSVLEVR